MIGFLRRFSGDDSGATAIEYGLIVALIAVAIVGALTAFGGANGGAFADTTGRVVDALESADD